jgi:hypothetical protein
MGPDTNASGRETPPCDSAGRSGGHLPPPGSGDGRSARNFRDAITIRARRAEVMTDLPITTAVATRARDIQLALTQGGHHRAASPTDLIAAAAAAEYGAIVVHYDRDFDLIADAGGPRCEWVSAPGTLP